MKKILDLIKQNKEHWYIKVAVCVFLVYSVVCWGFFLNNTFGIAFSHIISNSVFVVHAAEDIEEEGDISELDISSETDGYDELSKIDLLIKKAESVADALNSIWYGNMRGKKELSNIDTVATYLLTGEISSTQTLKGKEGWLFYKTTTDGDPIADYEGTNSFTLDEKNTIRNYNLYTQYILGTKGIEYRLLTIPNKETVYSNYMPDSYIKSDYNRYDDIVAVLSDESDPVNVISVKDDLIKYRDDYDLYYKYDTHWNILGGYVGTKTVVESLGIEMPDISELNISSYNLSEEKYEITEDDLAALCGLRWLMNDEQQYIYENMPEVDLSNYIVEQTSGDCYSHFTNAKATTDKSVLLLGDSFRTAMIPSLLEVFTDVYVAHRAYFMKGNIDVIRPDVLIAEYVERYDFELDSVVDLVWDR